MARLKALVTDITTVPEALRDQYVKEGDHFILDVDGEDYKNKINEFRTNNTKLQKKQTELEDKIAQFKDIDPAKYEEAVKALAMVNAQQDAELIKAGKIDEVIAKRTDTMRQQFERQVTALTTTNKDLIEQTGKYKGAYSELRISTEIQHAMSKAGLRLKPGAEFDVETRARRVWSIGEDDKLVGKDLFNDKGVAMTPEEWAKDLMVKAAHLFEPGQGGASKGGTKTDGAGQVVVANTPLAIGQNLQAIATGKMVVEGTR